MAAKFAEKFFNSALLENVVFTISQRGMRVASGWCSCDRVWEDGRSERYYEINICPEEFNRPIEDISEILLHELVHLDNALKGIPDCSSKSQYHNKKFKQTAEQHGLNVEKYSYYGFVKTSLKPETLEFIKSLSISNFDLFRNPYARVDNESEADAKDTEPKRPTSSTRKYVCPKCDLSVRATKEVRVRCDDCGELMVQEG